MPLNSLKVPLLPMLSVAGWTVSEADGV